MHQTDAHMSPDVAFELILRLDINAELLAAGRQLTLTDMEATADLFYYSQCGRHLYFNRLSNRGRDGRWISRKEFEEQRSK